MTPPKSHAKRDLLSIMDLDRGDVDEIFEHAFSLKAAWSARKQTPVLQGCTLAMIFEKPSLRTRSTFEVGIAQLGGQSIELSNANIGMGVRESVADIARNIDRWCDLIMIRTFAQSRVEEMAANAKAPVINGLTDYDHPCQALADVMTLMEKIGSRDMKGFPVAFIGDGNNVCHSLMCLAGLLGMDFRSAAPPGYEPKPRFVEWARNAAKKSGARITIINDPREALRGARAVYTDTWASMGQEHEQGAREVLFKEFQLNAAMLSHAERGAYVMHCLPAHRGEEITDDVMDGPQSIVFDQSEHRLHAQKGVMAWLAEKAGVQGFK
ncbi:ornithine carbamoyltransferase [soil metagenome]